MTESPRIRHEFVEFIPEILEPDMLHISVEYATCSHLCLCGCGERVVTPLAPTEWRLTFDGDTVSLHPSIGNWSFDCQSHYWIRRSRVIWAPGWSKGKIEANRSLDRRRKRKHYGELEDEIPRTEDESMWQRPLRRLRHRRSP